MRSCNVTTKEWFGCFVGGHPSRDNKEMLFTKNRNGKGLIEAQVGMVPYLPSGNLKVDELALLLKGKVIN